METLLVWLIRIKGFRDPLGWWRPRLGGAIVARADLSDNCIAPFCTQVILHNIWLVIATWFWSISLCIISSFPVSSMVEELFSQIEAQSYFWHGGHYLNLVVELFDDSDNLCPCFCKTCLTYAGFPRGWRCGLPGVSLSIRVNTYQHCGIPQRYLTLHKHMFRCQVRVRWGGRGLGGLDKVSIQTEAEGSIIGVGQCMSFTSPKFFFQY